MNARLNTSVIENPQGGTVAGISLCLIFQKNWGMSVVRSTPSSYIRILRTSKVRFHIPLITARKKLIMLHDF